MLRLISVNDAYGEGRRVWCIIRRFMKNSTIIEVSVETFQRLQARCKTLDIDPYSLGDQLVDSWLRQNLESLEGVYASMLRRTFMAQQYFETLPHEACIKDTSSRIMWANSLFEKMAGKNLEELFGKGPGEIWTKDEDQEFVQEVLHRDQEVIATRKALCRINKIRHGDRLRHRLTVRFPVTYSKTGDVLLIGTLGLDFATETAVNEARENIRLNGEWIAL